MDDDEFVGVVRPLRMGIELRRLPVSRPSCVSNGGMRREADNGGMFVMIVSHVQSHTQDLRAHRQRNGAYLIVGESPFPVAASTSSRSAETFPFFLMILD